MDRYRAIVFRVLDAKEADRVVYLLTDVGEKLVVIAKGVKKSKSRKAHAVDLLNFVEIKVVSGKGLPILTEAKLIDNFSKFKGDYTGLMFSQFVCEAIGLFAEEGQEDVGVFNNVFQLLQSAQPQKYALVSAALILRLLYNSGDLPKLNEDVETGEEITLDKFRVSAPIVGYQVRHTSSAEQIPDRLYKIQRFIIKQDFRQIQAIELSAKEQLQLLKLHIEWLQNVAEKELKTSNLFLQSLT